MPPPDPPPATNPTPVPQPQVGISPVDPVTLLIPAKHTSSDLSQMSIIIGWTGM